MFCRKCGSEIPDGSKFCIKCGEPVETPEMTNDAEIPVVDANRSRYRKIGIIAVIAAAVVVAAVVLVILFGGGRSYRKVIDEFFEAAIVDMDAEDMLELYPREIVRKEFGSYSYADNGDIYLEMEFGDRRGRPDINIVHNERYDDERLDSLRQELMSEYGISPSEARDVIVTYSVATRSGNDKTGAVQLSMIKLGRTWYLLEFDDADMSNLA